MENSQDELQRTVIKGMRYMLTISYLICPGSEAEKKKKRRPMGTALPNTRRIKEKLFPFFTSGRKGFGDQRPCQAKHSHRVHLLFGSKTHGFKCCTTGADLGHLLGSRALH